MISHHHRCIFVHVPKTAGQSIEQAFVRDLGLTWKTRMPLLLGDNPEPALGPPRLAHLTAGDYVALKYVPSTMFEEYYSFAFVRDPWARAASMYAYLGFAERCTFETFATTHLPGPLWSELAYFVRPQADFVLRDDGRPAVDFIGRFERLDLDFEQIATRVGLAERQLAHLNRTNPRKGPPPSVAPPRSRAQRFWRRLVREVRPPTFHAVRFTPVAIDAIGALYARDVQAFGYLPPPPQT